MKSAAPPDLEEDFHPRSKRGAYLHVRISTEDRRKLIALSNAMRLSGAEVVRSLIDDAFEKHEGSK